MPAPLGALQDFTGRPEGGTCAVDRFGLGELEYLVDGVVQVPRVIEGFFDGGSQVCTGSGQGCVQSQLQPGQGVRS